LTLSVTGSSRSTHVDWGRGGGRRELDQNACPDTPRGTKNALDGKRSVRGGQMPAPKVLSMLKYREKESKKKRSKKREIVSERHCIDQWGSLFAGGGHSRESTTTRCPGPTERCFTGEVVAGSCA